MSKNFKWYALKVLSGKENKSKERLERELTDYEKYYSEILLPYEKQYKLKDGKKTVRNKLTFPGYIFIRADLQGELKRTIRSCPGVIGFTEDGSGNPSVVRNSEIDRILGRIEKQENESNIPFVVGETVEIIDGPFSTFKGDIVKINKDKGELEVNVMIFGRETPVTLSFMQVDKQKVS